MSVLIHDIVILMFVMYIGEVPVFANSPRSVSDFACQEKNAIVSPINNVYWSGFHLNCNKIFNINIKSEEPLKI